MADLSEEKTKSPSVIGTFEGKCCDSNVFNNNDMHLNRELFDNLFNSEEYDRAIKNRYYIGFLGHPDDPGCMDYRNACIVMTECHIDDNGEVFGTFDLVNTPVGQTVKAFIDAGVTFGISIRGAGDVDGSGEVDPETFVFRGFDLVTFPAYNDCVPEFKEIAASSDLDKQVKYKKVCSTVKKNLSKITSCEALAVIQDQFRDDSQEFKEVGDRIEELSQEVELVDLSDAKLEAMTQLYLDEVEKNKQIEEEILSTQVAKNEVEVACSRKLASVKRIVGNQQADLNNKYKEAIRANSELKSKIKTLKAQKVDASSKLDAKMRSVEDMNLIYRRKIEANSKTISQKDSAIEDLKRQLNETVVARHKLESKASNLDENVKELSSRVEAAEQMVFEYQKAYANMYANALGVNVSNLSITSATTVSELQDMISSSTSSLNMPARADFVEEETIEPEFIGSEIVTI